MSQEDGADRSHEATPQKLMDARKKGELVKSQDVAVAASYAGMLLCLAFAAPAISGRLTDLGGALIQNADLIAEATTGGGDVAGGRIFAEAMTLTGFLIAPAALLVVVGLLAQQAIVVAPSKLAPKLQRVSILANAKNKFGPSGLFEFLKSAVKMAVYGGLMAWFLLGEADRIVAAAALEPRFLGHALGDILFDFGLAVVLVSGSIAAIDYGWQRHSHLVKNRMTRQEVLDETKQSEGDPHLRARRRQRAQEIATNRMLRDIPEATVVIVNPTHFAVALKWSPLDPSPPICVAKGVDLVAARIREVAGEADIPIFSDPPTARALHAGVEIGAPIDRAHFAAVATAIRFARELTERARR
ncbi:flagellar biosynthesis protein FlhB [Jannaschia sp. KMU-145]|uniref:EscU/YscU/HrcU family type III secretion system export apparatus switch protein n=1 Tax=Jannaschia halovivens TaxID=3388667 RepID=UPI00396AFF72